MPIRGKGKSADVSMKYCRYTIFWLKLKVQGQFYIPTSLHMIWTIFGELRQGGQICPLPPGIGVQKSPPGIGLIKNGRQLEAASHGVAQMKNSTTQGTSMSVNRIRKPGKYSGKACKQNVNSEPTHPHISCTTCSSRACLGGRKCPGTKVECFQPHRSGCIYSYIHPDKGQGSGCQIKSYLLSFGGRAGKMEEKKYAHTHT